MGSSRGMRICSVERVVLPLFQPPANSRWSNHPTLCHPDRSGEPALSEVEGDLQCPFRQYLISMEALPDLCHPSAPVN
jgi:hypothetical protein